MNWYKEYQTEWKEIIETVARELGKSEQTMELWLTMLQANK